MLARNKLSTRHRVYGDPGKVKPALPMPAARRQESVSRAEVPTPWKEAGGQACFG